VGPCSALVRAAGQPSPGITVGRERPREGPSVLRPAAAVMPVVLTAAAVAGDDGRDHGRLGVVGRAPAVAVARPGAEAAGGTGRRAVTVPVSAAESGSTAVPDPRAVADAGAIPRPRAIAVGNAQVQ